MELQNHSQKLKLKLQLKLQEIKFINDFQMLNYPTLTLHELLVNIKKKKKQILLFPEPIPTTLSIVQRNLIMPRIKNIRFVLYYIKEKLLHRARLNIRSISLEQLNPYAFLCRTGELDRRVRYPANRGRRMVRQNPADRASKHPDRNGAQGSAQGVHRHLGLLSRVPLRSTPGRAQKHHNHLRRGLRDCWLLRFQSGIRAARWEPFLKIDPVIWY